MFSPNVRVVYSYPITLSYIIYFYNYLNVIDIIYREKFSFHSWSIMMLLSQMIDSGVQSFLVVQQVDHHVECVNDTQAVSSEGSSLWVVDINVRKQSLCFGFQFDQPFEQQ